MNKKGFTLVELLAVISILAIILLIGVPTISKVIKDNKEKAYDIQISSFLGSVKIWATDNVRNLPVSGSASEVTLAQLENQAYVAKDVKNPLTGSAFDTTMSFCVRNINGEYDYSVSDGTGCSATSTKTNDGCFALSGNKITNYYDYVDNNSNNSVCPRDVVIPSSINGVSITRIGSSAFKSKKLTSVSIPDSVTMIDSEAFRSNNLTTVIIPDSVTTLGNHSFYSNKLTSVTISKKITTINTFTFAENKLASVTIPSSVTSIGQYAFYYDQITNLVLPNSVTSIGERAFEGNYMSTVTIPSSVKTIGERAFYLNKLTSVTIPSSVTSIGGGAFSKNDFAADTAIIYDRNSDGTENKAVISSYAQGRISSESTITIPSGVTTIKNYAFYTVLTSTLTLPDTLTSIGDYSFANNSIKSVVIPNSVTSIGEYAFGTNDIATLTIGTGITSISRGAFEYNELASVTIPTSITSIGYYAFANNEFTSITIPNNVTSIASNSFSGNSSLTAITVDNIPNRIANSPWGATNATITYLRGVHINIDSSITDLNVSPALVVAENSTITFTSSTLGKKVTSVTIDGVVNSGNTFTVGTADISVTAYTYDTVPYYTFESAHNYANSLDGSVSGTSLWTQTITGASSINITFSSDSKTESGYDYIFICSDNCSVTRTSTTGYLYKLDGTTMAGKTYNVTGDTIYVKLFSDGSQVYNGFTATVMQN